MRQVVPEWGEQSWTTSIPHACSNSEGSTSCSRWCNKTKNLALYLLPCEESIRIRRRRSQRKSSPSLASDEGKATVKIIASACHGLLEPFPNGEDGEMEQHKERFWVSCKQPASHAHRVEKTKESCEAIQIWWRELCFFYELARAREAKSKSCSDSSASTTATSERKTVESKPTENRKRGEERKE